MKQQIDLNADLGEGAPGEGELLGLVSSASIACGFHTGDPSSISASIMAARGAGVAVGAHPSLADRKNFGRVEIPVTAKEIFALVAYQVGAFQAMANSLGVRPNHVKPHGALYNMAARDPELAEAVAHAVLAVDSSLLIFAPEGSALARTGAAVGLPIAREVFADRNYLPDGSLVPRSQPDALLHDPKEAAARILRMLREQVVQAVDGSDIAIHADTICVHGDTAVAVAFARELRAALARAEVTVAALHRE
jgi:UPF0271 protein